MQRCPHDILGHPNNCAQCSWDRIKAERERYRKALERIAIPLGSGCGCGPVCHCFTPEVIRVEAEARIDLASAALAPTPEELGEQPLPFEGTPV